MPRSIAAKSAARSTPCSDPRHRVRHPRRDAGGQRARDVRRRAQVRGRMTMTVVRGVDLLRDAHARPRWRARKPSAAAERLRAEALRLARDESLLAAAYTVRIVTLDAPPDEVLHAAGEVVQRSVGIVDIFLVGGLGASAIAAVGIAQILVFVVMSVSWGINTGATVLVSQLWGAGRKEDAAQVSFQAMAFVIIASVIIMVLGYFYGWRVAALLGAGGEVQSILFDRSEERRVGKECRSR